MTVLSDRYPRLVDRQGQPGAVPLAGFATVEDVLAGLRERGSRVTPARRLLLAALFRDRAHRTAEELAAEVQAQAPDVNISTIYRNLDELVRLGVVDRSRLGGGPAAFHLASATHGHLICEQCGIMTEVPSQLFHEVAETLAARYGFAVNPHRSGVIGRCADCQRRDTGQLPVLPGLKLTRALTEITTDSSVSWDRGSPGAVPTRPARRQKPTVWHDSDSADGRMP
jgi:Fur family transcriptional regulator, ferric uptake regulator